MPLHRTEGPLGESQALRFDDMIATVLAQVPEDAAARTVAWRQLVDLAAQARDSSDPLLSDAVYRQLRAWRDEVPEEKRSIMARSLAGRRLSARLVEFFADDRAHIAEPLLTGARLADAEWLALLPRLTPAARSLIRRRRDLGAGVMQTLAGFDASEMAAEAPEPSAPTMSAPIERFPHAIPREADQEPRLAVPTGAAEPTEPAADEECFAPSGAAEPASETDIGHFSFETGPDGAIIWVEGAPRGPLIGLSIAVAALPGLAGVDGQVAGAFRQRESFRGARLTVAGEGGVSGAWRLSAVSCFEPVSGRFLGYRGVARRPRVDEEAASGSAYRLGAGLAPDSLRQLAHELKTPLNAIIGFGEMLHGQMLGPVAATYRTRAETITVEAQRVLGAVEDLDMAARLDSGTLSSEPEMLDGARVLRRVVDGLAPLVEARGVDLVIAAPDALPELAVDRRAAERMMQRLTASAIGLAESGERISVEAQGAGGMFELQVGRPHALAGLDEAVLLDPGYSPAGDWPDAPMLGLGFSLRLVRSLAAAVGGQLAIGTEQFVLKLPVVGEATQDQGEGRP